MKAVELKLTIYKEDKPEGVDLTDTKPLIKKIVEYVKESGFDVSIDMQSGDFTKNNEK